MSPVTVTQSDLDKLSYFKNTILANQAASQGLHYFQMAYFMHNMVRLPEDDFDRICRIARQMAAQGCDNYNKALEAIPEHVLEIGQQTGHIPAGAELVEIMRGVSEAHQQLKEARKYANGKE